MFQDQVMSRATAGPQRGDTRLAGSRTVRARAARLGALALAALVALAAHAQEGASLTLAEAPTRS